MKELILPDSGINDITKNKIQTDSSIVVVGPNGSGKTRLGAWIEFESEQKDKIHRISAQKSLSMPDNVRPTSMEKAKMELQIGRSHGNINENNRLNYKESSRWNQNPATSLLSDYEQLLTYLFSEDYEQMLEYKKKAKKSDEKIKPPKTKLDQVKDIWESIIPHRELKIASSSIKTVVEGEENKEYKAKEMSDGERVIFYLIGECLSVPENGIIVIDEPELHLHKSIQRKLFDRIEDKRSDCTFVYLTHDLDFASTRTGSPKICLNDYDGNKFYWYPVKENETIPEDVYLEIIGSRDPILFVEGEKGSHDEELYNLVYPEFTVKPVGSCTKVIEVTKSFEDLKSMHHLNCYGIIDRDYRSSDHIASLNDKNIYCPDVAEVENLFLIDEVLEAVAEQFCEPSPPEIVEDVHQWVFEEFKELKGRYALESTSAHLNYTLNSFDGQVQDLKELKSNYNSMNSDIDLEEYYNNKLKYSEQLIEEERYNEILKVFNHKGLVNQVGKFFEIKPSSYTKKVKNIINSKDKEIIDTVSGYLPNLA